MTTFAFEELETSDLIVGAEYSGGSKGNSSDDPINRLLPVGNQGGFRIGGRIDPFDVKAVVLYTSGHDPDWPDLLDPHTGRFVYFGDNKKPGRRLHATRGNQLLRECFARLHAGNPDVPPFFVFEKTGRGRSVKFLGLAVPGALDIGPDDDLVAIWRTTEGERFQNYRAVFTILDVAEVSRKWISDLERGEKITLNAPQAWGEWAATGGYRPLHAPKTVEHRSVAQQTPVGGAGAEILRAIHSYFATDPTAFEACAARIWQIIEPAAEEITITQASVDGGRDAIGRHSIGPAGDRVSFDFALEAKCYAPDNTVGVREMSRLISRLRHRQYGVLVTTSVVARQAYKEVREDGHPVAIVSGRDIVEALASIGITTVDDARSWLIANFKPSR